jgi:hypothetical protein
MKQILIKAPDDLAAAFDKAASARGGKSAVLRELMAYYIEQYTPDSLPIPPKVGPQAKGILVRLDPEELSVLDSEAEAQGMTRHAWAARSLRARLRQAPQFASDETRALAVIAGDLRRIGNNVNQIARALNVALLDGKPLQMELAGVREAHADIMEFAAAVRRIRQAKISYWIGDHE